MANDTSRVVAKNEGIGVRTHIPSEVLVEADTGRRRAADNLLRTRAAAAEGSNHPGPGEDLK